MKLLAALVALVGVLVLAVALGGLLLWREYGRLRGTVALAAGGGEHTARQLMIDVSRKQLVASQELTSATKDATRQIAEFERRAEQLRHQGGGAISSASRAVETTQLMADQLLLQLKLMTTLESALEKALRPLPEQNELLQAVDRNEGPATERRQGRKPPPDR